MRTSHAIGRVALCVLLASACNRDEPTGVRGRGLAEATLSAADQARVYEAAARTAFQVDDAGLSLLFDSRQLPRDVGLASTSRVTAAVAAELRQRGVVRGTCEPPLQGTRGAPLCTAARPGYVVRFSPVFALRADSVQVYLYAQKYDTPGSERSQALRFERAYQVVRRGDDWHAAREGRVPKEIRGEKR
ncbi:MAG: hypothetical protein ABJF01_22555 [bacterium]